MTLKILQIKSKKFSEEKFYKAQKLVTLALKKFKLLETKNVLKKY